MTDNYDPFARVVLKPHRSKGKNRGFYVYLPRQAVAAALGLTEPPEALSAARLVLDPGTGQILIRLYREK